MVLKCIHRMYAVMGYQIEKNILVLLIKTYAVKNEKTVDP
jgi:hypothetical protein